jgi:hypothetical protein
MKLCFIFSLLFILSFPVFSQEISIISNQYRSFVAERISAPAGQLVYREIMHPSRCGVKVVDGNGVETLGLVYVKESEVISTTDKPLNDSNMAHIKVGSIVSTRIRVGRSLKRIEGEVLLTFANDEMLISYNAEFIKTAKEYDSIPYAVEQKGYSYLSLVQAKNAVVVK